MAQTVVVRLPVKIETSKTIYVGPNNEETPYYQCSVTLLGSPLFHTAQFKHKREASAVREARAEIAQWAKRARDRA